MRHEPDNRDDGGLRAEGTRLRCPTAAQLCSTKYFAHSSPLVLILNKHRPSTTNVLDNIDNFAE